MFWGHPDILARDRIDNPKLRRLKCRPAPIFFVSPGPLSAGIVEQPLRDILPDGVAAVQSDCIRGLNLHGPLAATAGNAKYVALDIGEPSRSDLRAGCAGARVVENRVPIFRGQKLIFRHFEGSPPPSSVIIHFSICCGRHAPPRWSVGHSRLEHIKNKCRVRPDPRRRKNDPVGKRGVSEPSRLDRLESSISIRSSRNGPSR